MIQPLLPDGPPPPAPADPWADYLAAAQRLDAVRRAASTAATEQAQTAQAAQQELTGVRARLEPQRSRLVRDFGVPEADLTALPAEVAAATETVGAGPAAALAGLRHARGTADAADAAMMAVDPTVRWTPWLRNLLVYGPFALVVLVVQITLYLTVSSDSLPMYALLCGLTMPLLAFGLGWVTVGFVFGGRSAGKVDRTPVIGAVVCLSPVLVTCMGVGLLAIVR